MRYLAFTFFFSALAKSSYASWNQMEAEMKGRMPKGHAPFMGLNVQDGHPDKAPSGYEQWVSPLVVPSPEANGAGDWTEAVRKAKAFVKDLTVEELVNITTGTDTKNRCVGNTGRITRLNFPGLCYQDSPLGVRFADYVSVFPAGITTATTWDRDLARARGEAMGAEFRGKGVNVALGPMNNIGRVAGAGRGWEGFGSEPFLSGVMAAETVQGIQSKGVIANTKHLALNSQEHYRGGSGGTAYSSNCDDRTMHEVYMWAFAEAIKAGVGSVMCAYNRLNQTFACENSKLLNGLVKEELGFQGFIVSDWAAMVSGVSSALAGTDSNMPGFTAYGQPDEPNPDTATHSYWGKHLIEAVNNGSVPLTRLQDMVTRTMAAYYKMGQDEGFPPVNFDSLSQDTYIEGQKLNEHVNVQRDHYKVIREIGTAGTVLLKNQKGSLPLQAQKIKRLAIVGSDAGPSSVGPNAFSDHAGDEGTLAIGWGSGTADFPYLVDPLSAIQTYVRKENPDVMIDYSLADFNLEQASAIARQADTCLVFGNSDSGEGYLEVDNNQGDRNNLTLWHGGDDLIKAVASECDNTIVVLHTVGPVLVEEWIENKNITGVLYANLPGQESGNSIRDVLFGQFNPSGRLPYAIAKKRSDYPVDILYNSSAAVPQINYSEKLLVDWRWFDAKKIQPRFHFGFGLSYTKFEYSGLKISLFNKGKRAASITRSEPIADPKGAAWDNDLAAESSHSSESVGGPASLWEKAATVTFTVKNTGKRDGHEVAQLYIGYPESAGEPPKVLRGFERVQIASGASAKVSISLRRKDISVWDVVDQTWHVPSGHFTVFVGASSNDEDLYLKGTFDM